MAPGAAPTGSSPPAGPLPDGRRFPGVQSFQEHEQPKFRGRRAAIDALLLRVLSVPLLLQFAPSGVGKTSLLNAGLFPALRPHHYFPVMVRLNKTDESLAQAVRRSLADAARDFGLVDPVIPVAADTLRDLLGGTQLWSRQLLLLTPVLVFDQFEEIFTLRDDAFRQAFAAQLGALRAAPGAAGGPSLAQVKVILSLREEFLGKLEQLSAQIPDLFRERLRLAPLTAAEATEAMVEPARLAGAHWACAPFEFAPACLDALIDFIDGASDSLRVIEALTLQLVCQRAEAIVLQRRGSEAARQPLLLDDFGGLAGLERLVRRHYQDELAKLPDGRTRGQAQMLFEQGLLDPAGKRLMLEQNEIQRKYGLGKPALDQLVAASLLRCEPRNEKSVFYEISHDRLTESIAKHRKPHLPRWVWPTLAGGSVVVVCLLLGIWFVLRQADETLRARNQADYALQRLLGEDLVSRLREAGLSDALKHVLQTSGDDASVAARVNGLAQALKLRHEGDIERAQGTGPHARAKFDAAQALINTLLSDAALTAHPLLLAEAARLQQRLAALLAEGGESVHAEAQYGVAIALWDQVIKGPAPWQDQLDAAEIRIASGGLKASLGDLDGAEPQFVEAGRLAGQVVRTAYDEVQRGTTDGHFKLGRAVQVFADVALNLSLLYFDPAASYRAVTLAREAVRLRPVSFEARKQLGTALIAQARTVVDPDTLQARLAESRALFDGLGQQDPGNRQMQRERAALQMASAEAVAACAANPACKPVLRNDDLDQAQLAALEAMGQFRWLAGLNRHSQALNNDLAWGLRTQASLLAATGQPAQAIPLLDEGLRLQSESRAARKLPDDAESGLRRADFLQQKARLQAAANRALPAIESLDAAKAVLAALPAALRSVQEAQIQILDDKGLFLRQSGQSALAGQVQKTRSALFAALPQASEDQRKTLAGKRNDDGVAIARNLQALNPVAQLQRLREALAKHEQALADDAFDPVFWQNLGRTQQKIARLAASGDAASGLGPAVQAQALRQTTAALWLAAVLGTEAQKGQRLKELYEAQRELAMLLQDSNKTTSLAFAEQGVRDAQALLGRQGGSADALWYLADAHYGLALLRDGLAAAQGTAQPQEAFRLALLLGQRLALLEPTSAQRQNWLAGVHAHLANRLDETQQPAGAAQHRQQRLMACKQALRLAKLAPLRSGADGTEAAACLAELAEQGLR